MVKCLTLLCVCVANHFELSLAPRPNGARCLVRPTWRCRRILWLATFRQTLPTVLPGRLLLAHLSHPIIKVHPHYAVRHTVAQGDKAAQQKSRHAASICGRCVGSVAACHSTLRGLKIWSANCWLHQTKPRGIWWVRGFKMVSASLRKKSDKVHQYRSTVFVTWRRSAKNSFFMWHDHIGGICRATFVAGQRCSVLHSAARHSVDAPSGKLLQPPLCQGKQEKVKSTAA